MTSAQLFFCERCEGPSLSRKCEECGQSDMTVAWDSEYAALMTIEKVADDLEDRGDLEMAHALMRALDIISQAEPNQRTKEKTS